MQRLHYVGIAAFVLFACSPAPSGTDSGMTQCNASNNFCVDAGSSTDAGPTADSGAPCNATTCPTGCCAQNGACRAGGTDIACGTGGAACQDCTATGRSCVSHVCVAPPQDAGVDAGSTVCVWDQGNWDQCVWAP